MQGRVRRAVGLAAVAVLAVGCSKSIDVPDLEQRLAGELQAELNIAYTVNCPDEVEAKKGNDFVCSAKGEDGTDLTLRITQTDDNASVTYEIVEG
jgi:uncharacterized protein DUF4333